jgi:general secretion pathway protein D
MNIANACLVALLFAMPAFAPAQDMSAANGPGCAKSSDCADLADLFRDFSKRTGRKFIIDPRVRAVGGVIGVDSDKLTYEQLLALAAVNQFVVIPQGDLTVVLPDASARQQPTPVYYDTSFKAYDDEWVTLLISGKNACVAHLVPILRPLMPQAAHLAANPVSNQMVISDRAVNARRIAQLLYKIDEATPPGRHCPDPEAYLNAERGREPPTKK